MSGAGGTSPLSDVDLTRAAQAGDAGSLGVLLARHQAGMRAVALSMIGYGPDIDDVVQDAALLALRPIQERYRELVADPAAVSEIVAKGADKAREIATPVIEKLGISWQQQEQQAAQPK